MEQPESSLPYSQAPATCPYPEPTPSSPHNPFPLPGINIYHLNKIFTSQTFTYSVCVYVCMYSCMCVCRATINKTVCSVVRNESQNKRMAKALLVNIPFHSLALPVHVYQTVNDTLHTQSQKDNVAYHISAACVGM
jgi:hypothetical protein